jgi:hypothetical protein
MGLHDFRAANLAPERSFVDVAVVGHHVSRNVRRLDTRTASEQPSEPGERSTGVGNHMFSSLSPCVHKGPCVRVDRCGEVPEVERICGKPYAGLGFLSGERQTGGGVLALQDEALAQDLIPLRV